MRLPVFGGVDVQNEAELRFVLSLLPTEEEVERAKRAQAIERAESGLILNADGRIVGVRES